MTSSPSRAERKKDEMRREIIDAAFDCFAENGYHATGIADIATKMGIGHGTFYRYFQNKRDIIDVVITDMVQRIVTALSAENAPGTADNLEQYRDQTARIAEALTEVFAADRRIPQLLLLQAPGVDAEMTQRVFGFFDSAAAMTGSYLAHGVKMGYLRADLDIDITARAINGMILAAVLNGLRTTDDEGNKRFITAIRRVMYEGIAA